MASMDNDHNVWAVVPCVVENTTNLREVEFGVDVTAYLTSECCCHCNNQCVLGQKSMDYAQ